MALIRGLSGIIMTNNVKLSFFVSFIYSFYHKIQITIKQDSYTKANEIGEEAQKETIRLSQGL